MKNTMTVSPKEMILTESEKQEAIKKYIDQEQERRERVFGQRVRIVDRAEIEYDEDEILEKANIKKHYEVENEKYRTEKDAEDYSARLAHFQYWDYSRMFTLLNYESYKKGVQFDYNDDNKIAVQALCFYLSRNPRFETELGFDFSKGIMLRGKYGTGKTHMVKCLSDNGVRPIRLSSMIRIKDKVQEEGYYYLGVDNYYITYLDDVGSEDLPLMHFGTKINWFKDFIEKVYYDNKNFSNLIFSTNLNLKELQEKYGERVTDRIAEMFNIIDVKGTSKRIAKLKVSKKEKQTDEEKTA